MSSVLQYWHGSYGGSRHLRRVPTGFYRKGQPMKWKYDKKHRVWSVNPHEDPSCTRCIVTPSFGGESWSFQAHSRTGNGASISGTAVTVKQAKANCEEFADKYGIAPKLRKQMGEAMRQSRKASERRTNSERTGNDL